MRMPFTEYLKSPRFITKLDGSTEQVTLTEKQNEIIASLDALSDSEGEVITLYHWRELCGIKLDLVETYHELNQLKNATNRQTNGGI